MSPSHSKWLPAGPPRRRMPAGSALCLPSGRQELPTAAHSRPCHWRKLRLHKSSGSCPPPSPTASGTSPNCRGRHSRGREQSLLQRMTLGTMQSVCPPRADRHKGAGERPTKCSYQNLPPPLWPSRALSIIL